MDRFSESKKLYDERGFGKKLGFGKQPALIIVDFIKAFTDKSSALGGDYDKEIEELQKLIAKFREKKQPIIYTTMSYHPSLKDGGIFVQKVPTLEALVEGSPLTEIDDRIKPKPDDFIIEKKFASSFFGTTLSSLLNELQVDTLIITGCSTSGCVRATVLDANQHGLIPIVPKECVGDRQQVLHENNLFDIDAKYGDVVSNEELIKLI